MSDKSDPKFPAGMKPVAGGASPAPDELSDEPLPGQIPGGPIPPGAIPPGGPMPPGGPVPPEGGMMKAGEVPPGAMPPGGPMPQGGAMPPGAMPPPGPMPPPGEVPADGGMMKPASLPAGASLPEGGSMPQGGAVPDGMIPKPKLDARPYIKRSLNLLRKHKTTVVWSGVLTLVGSLLPFVVSASFGPLLEILGNAARQGGMDNVWDLTGSLYQVVPPPGSEGTPVAPLTGIRGWLGTPLSFKTIFVVWAIATVGSAALRFVQMWVMSNLEQKIVAEIQAKVYDHLQTLSLDFFTGGKTGGLMQRVLNESQNVQKLITQVLFTPILDVFVLIVALFYLFILSWQMTLVSFALGPVAFWLFRVTMNKLQSSANHMMEVSRDLNSELNESLTGMADIQIFNAQEKRSGRFATLAHETANQTAKLFMWMHLSNSNSLIYVALSTALVLLVGIQYGPRFGLGLGALVTFTLFIPNMFAPVQRVITSYSTYKSLVPGIVATYQLLDTKPTVVEKPNARKLGDIHGDIKFENIVFGYTPFKTILDGVSFEIREGEIVAFVGAIGCGKSTIMNLLLRFLEQDAGKITIGGEDITEVTLASLREQVSKLSQFPFFLKDTIRENVRLGRVSATDAEVEQACRLANIHDTIINEIPGGYNCTVGDQVPSGGQKRLIAFARCLIRQPEVLLLDEPTENLNETNRIEMARFVHNYAKGANKRTCIVISHDMNFVHLVADRIIVIDKGKAVQSGTHAELLQQDGIYKTLYELKNINPDLLRTREGAGGVAGGGGEPDELPPGFAPA
ncbi:MAG: ABC transporter ATP-binding protein [Pyrinomonadaceae bacterium]